MTLDTWLTVFAVACIVIGLIVAFNIRESESDKQKGDKKVVVTVFLMSALVFGGIVWARRYCSTGIAQSIYDATGYDTTQAERMRAAGIKA